VTAIHKSALVPYSAAEMYVLVADVDRYGEFLPWCGGAKVLTRTDNEVTASIRIAYGSLQRSFTTRNTLEPDRGMTMQLVDGPFRRLHGVWRFAPLDEQACKVSLDLDFEFENAMLSLVAGPAFSRIANSLVDSFRDRAVALYGRR
jgi:ribosome-associated toxin RatA of RatAB toxin-antitoxin module